MRGISVQRLLPLAFECFAAALLVLVWASIEAAEFLWYSAAFAIGAACAVADKLRGIE